MRIVLFAPSRVRYRLLLLFVLLLLLAVIPRLAVRQPVERSVVSSHLLLSGKKFVIDPGHGGYDPGVMRGNIEEKQIVLGIALALRDYLQTAGAQVVMTRETDKDFLTVPSAGPKKQQDMKNRMKVVNEIQPDLLISLHANSIGSSVWHGAQVFYKYDSDQSKGIAEFIQRELIRVLQNTDRVIKPGDYYVLNNTESLAVLVECGFISNPQEAQQLTSPAYQSKVAWAVYGGLIHYFSQPQTDS